MRSFNLALHKMYAKLSLCAKREKVKIEEERFGKLSDDAFDNYQSQLTLGESIGRSKRLRTGTRDIWTRSRCLAEYFQNEVSTLSVSSRIQ